LPAFGFAAGFAVVFFGAGFLVAMFEILLNENCGAGFQPAIPEHVANVLHESGL